MKPKESPAGRPPAFVYRKNILHCEGAPVSRLAEKYGTPLYVYSLTTIRDRCSMFDRAFHGIPHTICYSVKANSNLAILKTLAGRGYGFDVVSGGELQRVLHAAKKAARNVVFSGVGKTADEMQIALRAGILMFNVESDSEMAALARCAAHVKKKARIAFRVNPDVSAETHPYISTGLHKHKFGVPIDSAVRLYSQAAREKWLEIAGVSVHIGSQITDVEPFTEAMERVVELVRRLQDAGHDIRYVDAGGGLGIRYDAKELPEFKDHVAEFARAVTRPLRGLKVHLLLEPGRSIVGPAGALIVRVIYRKSNNGKSFIVVDGAMNDLIRPALYGAHHDIVPVVRDGSGSRDVVDVVGPICETGDFFARDRQLPSVAEGQFLAILDTGAYGMSITSNYNTRPRAAEVLVEGKRSRVIRKRETVEELFRQEVT